jgi:hypothetical protein
MEFYDDNMDFDPSGSSGRGKRPEDGYGDDDFSSNGSATSQLNAAIMGTTHALLKAYASLKATELVRLFAPSFRHQVLPESLGIPVRDLAAFTKHAEGIFSVFDKFRMVPIRDPLISHCHGPPVVTIQAKMNGVLKGNKGPWLNECVLVVTLTPDASKIQEILEFVDSAKALLMARKHAPDNMGRKEGFDALVHRGIPTVVSFTWLLLTMMVSSVIGSRPALVVLWVHPVLEVLLETMMEDDPVYKLIVGGVGIAKRSIEGLSLGAKVVSVVHPMVTKMK